MTNTVDPSIVASVLPPAETASGPSAADVARFQQLVDDGALRPGLDAYLDGPPVKPAVSPEFDRATSKLQALGTEMRQAMSGGDLPALPDSAPIDLHIAHYTLIQMRHVNTAHTQFMLATKVVEQSSKSVNTLYKLNG